MRSSVTSCLPSLFFVAVVGTGEGGEGGGGD